MAIQTGRIYNEDCMDTMARMEDNEVDLVLTDPPYGTGEPSGTIGKNRSNKTNYDNDVNSYNFVKNKVIPAIKEAMRVSKRLIVTPGTHNLTEYPSPDSFGSVYQPATVGMQKWGRADSQPIFYYGRDPRAGKTIQKCTFKCTEKSADVDHPCPKPINLWTKLLKKGSLENEKVYDPFIGSGTTAVISEQLNRKWLGSEISDKYCKLAKKRVKKEQDQLKFL